MGSALGHNLIRWQEEAGGERAFEEDAIRNNPFIAFVLYECQGAHDATFFFVGVSVGRAEHSLAGPFQSKAAACTWIEGQTTIQTMASP